MNIKIKIKSDYEKKGYIIAEAAIFIPVFLFSVVLLIYIIQMLRFQEIIHHEAAVELINVAAPSYSEEAFRKIIDSDYTGADSDAIPEDVETDSVQNSGSQTEFFIRFGENLFYKNRLAAAVGKRIEKDMKLKANLTVEDDVYIAQITYPITLNLPFGIGDDIVIKDVLVSRNWSGCDNSEQTPGFDAMERSDDENYVFIFPRYGERYHEGCCRYLYMDEGRYIKGVSVYDAAADGYTKCQVCH